MSTEQKKNYALPIIVMFALFYHDFVCDRASESDGSHC